MLLASMLTVGPRWRAAGFSLMEMAVVLMIMGILMGGVLVSVSQTTLNARRATALAQLRSVEEALYGFAESQGRLPCPASDTSGGYEAGTAGSCTLTHGFVPGATLGMFGQVNDDGLLLDPWQNPLRYSVAITADTTSPGNPDFTNYQINANSIRTFFGNSSVLDAGNALNNMFKVCDSSDCSGTTLTDIAPAVVLTMGENWASYSSTNEGTNAGSTTVGSYVIHANTDLVFVSATYSEDNFDDQLVWLSPYILFNRMVSAGKLP